MIYPEPLEELIRQLQKLPTVGAKTALRLALAILKMFPEDADQIANSITDVKNKITFCKICAGITELDPCQICTTPRRDRQQICVVEEPDDLLAIERTQQHRGVYHVLMGVLSPMNGIGPSDLRIDSLIQRIETDQVREVIIATNHTTEGSATALFLAKKLSDFDLKVTRIAFGIPVGGDLGYIDDLTIGQALRGRRQFEMENN